MDLHTRNTGITIGPKKDSDFVFGDGNISHVNNEADWSKYLSEPEPQSILRLDTMGCASFSAINSIETQINWMWDTGKLPTATKAWLLASGFVHQAGRLNASDRFTAKDSKTTIQGNSMTNVGDSLRKNGLLPEIDLPMISDQGSRDANWREYYKELPQPLKDKAKEFLTYFSIKYHWISYDEKTTEIDALDKALLQAPVQIAIQTCPPWMDNSAINACSFSSPNHCIMIYDYNQLWKVLDQYPEYLKTLSHDYLIPFAMQYIVTPIPQPESVFVPSVPLIDSSEITSKKITLIQLILSKMRQLLDLLTKK